MMTAYKMAVLAALWALGTLSASAGAEYKVLHNFGVGNDGQQPYGPPLLGQKGSLYGVTANGGTGCGGAGCGTVFELTPKGNGKWSEQVLYGFIDTGHGYAFPEGNLVQDAAGKLYGFVRSYYCCYTAVFELSQGSAAWNFNTIWTQGAGPGLLMDGIGDLYGFMGYHAAPIAELSPGSNGWTYADLSDKNTSLAPLNWDAHGNLYGTDPYGGNEPPKCPWSGGCGTAFQLTPNSDSTWNYHVLHTFAAFKGDGLRPFAGLVEDAAGNAYGATSAGGKYNCGTVFKLSPSSGGHWKQTVLYQLGAFAGAGCAPLYSLAFDSAGSLYGMAQGGDANCGPCGLIFKLSPQRSGKWKYSTLHTFHGPEGADPYGVILDSKGNIFGTTMHGGKYGLGTAFEITQ